MIDPITRLDVTYYGLNEILNNDCINNKPFRKDRWMILANALEVLGEMKLEAKYKKWDDLDNLEAEILKEII